MSIKLTYFDLRGRGELSRLVLRAAKKQYEDVRIQFSDWPALKASTPYGSLPVLVVDGKEYAQSVAITNYLARITGLYGSNSEEQLKIDEIHQLREDLIAEEIKANFENDAAKKAELGKNLKENIFPRFLGYFTKVIKESKSKSNSDFVVGKKLSLADLVIYEGTQNLAQNFPDVLDKYPELKAFRAFIEKQDSIKQYLATRKVSDF